MKYMITQNGKHTIHTFVHTFQAYRTGGQFGVTQRRLIVFAPFNARYPNGMTEIIGLQGIVRGPIESFVKFKGRTNATESI